MHQIPHRFEVVKPFPIQGIGRRSGFDHPGFDPLSLARIRFEIKSL
jgi:hypothetical protein